MWITLGWVLVFTAPAAVMVAVFSGPSASRRTGRWKRSGSAPRTKTDDAQHSTVCSSTDRPLRVVGADTGVDEGAERGVGSITTGLGWEQVAAAVVVSGPPANEDLRRCWELGATLAAGLMP